MKHTNFVIQNNTVCNLEYSNCERDLGVLVDSDLSFEMHTVDKDKKVYRILGLIKRNFRFLDTNCFYYLINFSNLNTPGICTVCMESI